VLHAIGILRLRTRLLRPEGSIIISLSLPDERLLSSCSIIRNLLVSQDLSRRLASQLFHCGSASERSRAKYVPSPLKSAFVKAHGLLFTKKI
jgi:hypothetical protein